MTRNPAGGIRFPSARSCCCGGGRNQYAPILRASVQISGGLFDSLCVKGRGGSPLASQRSGSKNASNRTRAGEKMASVPRAGGSAVRLAAAAPGLLAKHHNDTHIAYHQEEGHLQRRKVRRRASE